MVLQAIKYKPGQLSILDQLQLPHVEAYTELASAEDGWHAIKEMRVRGAPAIAIVAALALTVELHGLRSDGKLSENAEEVEIFIIEKLDYLVTSRPTAVNLADAVRKLKSIVKTSTKESRATGETVARAYEQAAEQMLVDDVQDNQNIGEFGAKWILENTALGKKGDNVGVLTHCNTGSLATAGYGTALGIIRSLRAAKRLDHAYCTETRPYNQGSRLTAYELVHDEIPATLITDSMAAALLAMKGDDIAAIVVGADSVAANGDTANKIGTYNLAVLARHHGVKFLVAAPRTTIDLSTKSGDDIVIEERPKSEVTHIRGPRVVAGQVYAAKVQTISIAAKGIDVWNPAFDVTPSRLIDAIITEVGALEKGARDFFQLERLFDVVRNGNAS